MPSDFYGIELEITNLFEGSIMDNHLIFTTEHRCFEQKLAFHTAPSLLGIKCASLFSVKKDELDISASMEYFNSRAAVKGLKIRILCECKERILLLVYSEIKLSQRLACPECRDILRDNGYTDDMTTEECIALLSERIRCQADFPHEIGIFLDYPVEDVVGFIANNGCNFKLCGYWKVYGDTEKAQRTFDNYNKCRRFLCGRLSEGEDICRALKIS